MTIITLIDLENMNAQTQLNKEHWVVEVILGVHCGNFGAS